MSDNQNGVPITYVTDPPVATGTAIIQGGTIAATGIGGGPVQAYIVGGTIATAFNFVGSITTDIGSVLLEDADNNWAVIPPAQDTKSTATKALVVQTVDRLGQTLSLANQEAIVNSGSNSNDLLANIDLNTMAATVYLAEIASTQGTQSTALLSTIADQQGTLATSVNQTDAITKLAQIMNNFGTISQVQVMTEHGDPIESTQDGNGKYHLGVEIIQSVYSSAKNTTYTNLAFGGSYVGDVETTLGIAGIHTVFSADQNCTVCVDQSGNSGTNWDIVDNYTYHATTGGASWTTQAVGNTFRVRVINSGTSATTYLRLSTALCPIVEAVPRAVTANGNFKVAINELLGQHFGPASSGKTSPLGKLVITDPVRLAGMYFGDNVVIDANFWGSNVTNNGTIVPGGNQASLQTGVNANGTASLITTRSARFVPGHTNYYFGMSRAPTATGANVRRWGTYDSSNGFFFELQGGYLALVCRKGGVDNRVTSGSFNGEDGPVYILDANAHTFEIHYTLKNAWFLIDSEIIHTFSGLTAPLTNTNSLPVRAETVNSNGNTANNILELRVASICRYGSLQTETAYKYIASATTTVCKYGAGRLMKVVINNPDAAAQDISIYDSIGGATSPIAVLGIPNIANTGVPVSLEFGCPFFNGLTVITSNAAPVTIIYE